LIFKVLVLSLVFLFKDTNSENLINTNKLLKYNLVEGDINKFFKSLKKVCEKKLLQNLQKHPSYPSLGTANQWKLVCNNLKTKALNKSFLLQNFRFKELSDKVGILTGYYEPEIMVSFKKTKKFNIPLLKYNKDYEMLERKKIESNFRMEDVLIWTNDKIDLFFLQIQGSGIGTLENKKQVKINYGGNNKKKYSSIGKFLKKKKLIKGEINLFSIKKFLRQNPDITDQILNQNERYIFFDINKKNTKKSSVGSIGLNLSPYTSVAIDKKYYPLGMPLVLHKVSEKKLLPVISMDTGGAIIGKNRADLFTGRGVAAEKIAGELKKKLLIYVLVPKDYND
tara:strand:+ start:4330 stop:5343 length:1014 start_codon:yes stop_codon:yes gene_type:complete